MTANGNPDEPSGEPSGPHPYFLAIEEVFLELRGAPLQLSPKDWQIARGWHEAGIPLELVERTVREVFARRAAKVEKEKEEGRQKREEKVWSLSHFKRPIQAAWRRLQELEAPGAAGEAEALDLPARLERLAASLPAGVAGREAAAGRIRALEGDAQAIEDRLAEIDGELLETARAGLSELDREAIEGELAAARRSLAGRLDADELERAEGRLREEILRRRFGLPVLSLFAPEAAGAQ